MLNKITFYTIALSICLTSCSKNDNDNKNEEFEKTINQPVITNCTFHYPKADLDITYNNTDSNPVTEVGCYIGGETNFSSGFMKNNQVITSQETTTKLTTGSVTTLNNMYLLPYIITARKGKIFGKVYIFNTNHQECNEYCDFNPKDPNIMSEILKGYTGDISDGDSPTEDNPSSSLESVSEFTVNTERKKRVLNAKYIGTNKKYLLTIREYSEVKYHWTCSNSKVTGILIARSPIKLTNGVKCTDYKSIYQPRNGEYIIQEWQESTSYVDFYVWSYSSNYQYSKNYYQSRKYIEGIHDYEMWSNTPYLQ